MGLFSQPVILPLQKADASLSSCLCYTKSLLLVLDHLVQQHMCVYWIEQKPGGLRKQLTPEKEHDKYSNLVMREIVIISPVILHFAHFM